jgi:hypothetical protein
MYGAGGFQVKPAVNRWRHGHGWRCVAAKLVLSPRGWRRSKLLLLLRAQGELRRRCIRASHPVGRYPSRVINLGFDPLSPKVLHNIGNPHPQHSDGESMLAWFVIHRELYLVGLVNLDAMKFIFPAICPGRASSCHYIILDFDRDECFRAPRESASGSMIYVPNLLHPDGQLSGQRLPHIGHVYAIICRS